jgi:ATP-dependent helicase/nuclease subunit A
MGAGKTQSPAKVIHAEAEKAPDPEILEEGVHFHKLLEFLVPQSSKPEKSPVMPSEQEVMNWLGVDQAVAKKLLAHIQVVLNAPELKLYLSPGEWLQAWNELDIASEEGKSFRLDRLVEMGDHLAIIDYKLTIPNPDSEMYGKYLKQLQNYQKELKRIRPDKENRAYLISSGGKIEQIGQAV